MNLDYMDIGHGKQCFMSVLWLYRDGKLETRSAAEGTHNSTWGGKAMHYYRGRFDKESACLSIAPPSISLVQLKTPPRELLTALKVQFDFKAAYYFPQSGCIKVEAPPVEFKPVSHNDGEEQHRKWR